MTPEQQTEVTKLLVQMRDYFDALVTAGMSDAIVCNAALYVISDRVLASTTPEDTAEWLRAQAADVLVMGPAMKELWAAKRQPPQAKR